MVNGLISRLPEKSITVLPQDSYYRDNSHKTAEERQQINFDHPDAVEWDLLTGHIRCLKSGKPVRMPVYSFITNSRSDEAIPRAPGPVLLVEGILILHVPALRELLDIKVFVDTDAEDRRTRIIRRDAEERGRTAEQGQRHYETFVEPMHRRFIEPSKRHADIIVPNGGQNRVAIDILASFLRCSRHPDFAYL